MADDNKRGKTRLTDEQLDHLQDIIESDFDALIVSAVKIRGGEMADSVHAGAFPDGDGGRAASRAAAGALLSVCDRYDADVGTVGHNAMLFAKESCGQPNVEMVIEPNGGDSDG